MEAVWFLDAESAITGVMATGHGVAAPCDGGVLINTSRMRGVRVDPEAQTPPPGATHQLRPLYSNLTSSTRSVPSSRTTRAAWRRIGTSSVIVNEHDGYVREVAGGVLGNVSVVTGARVTHWRENTTMVSKIPALSSRGAGEEGGGVL